MVGTNAATGIKLEAVRRHGRFERMISRVEEYAARIRAEELDRMTWTEEVRRGHADPGRHSREAGSTPLRWVRLA